MRSPVLYFASYLLSYSMEHSPFWETTRFSPSQEIPLILWNPKFHYCFYMCLPPVPVLSQEFCHLPHFISILLRFLPILCCSLLFCCMLFPHSCPTNLYSKKYILPLFFGQIKNMCLTSRIRKSWGQLSPPTSFLIDLNFWSPSFIWNIYFLYHKVRNTFSPKI